MEYVLARKEYVKWISESDENLIPLEFGTVKAPGLSDLDLGILAPEGINNTRLFKEFLKRIPSRIVKIMNGGTIMIFKNVNDIHYIDPIDLRRLDSSSPLEIEDPSPNEKTLLNLVRVVEWLPERLARISGEVANHFPNPKRLVGYIYSLRYSLIMLKSFGKNTEEIEVTIDEIEKLRSDILRMGLDLKVLKTICADILSRQKFYIDIVTAEWRKHIKVLPTNRTATIKLGASLLIEFSESDIGIQHSGSFSHVNLPIEFLSSYYHYVENHDSNLSRILSENIEIPGSIKFTYSTEMHDLLLKRGKAICNAFQFPSSMNLDSGAFKFGWYL